MNLILMKMNPKFFNILFICIVLNLMNGSESAFDEDGNMDIVQTLKEGIKMSRDYLADNKDKIRAFFDSLNFEDGLDTERWVEKSHSDAKRSHQSDDTSSKRSEEPSIMDMLQEVMKLRASYDAGELGLKDISRVVVRMVDFVAENPEYAQDALNFILQSNPSLRKRSDELINKLLPILLDALVHGSAEAILDKRVLVPIMDILSEMFVDPSILKPVKAVTRSVIDLISESFRVVTTWYENATDAVKRAQMPEVAEVFREILLEPVRALRSLTNRVENLVRALQDLPAPIDSDKLHVDTQVKGLNPIDIDKRHVDTLVKRLNDVLKEARQLDAALDDPNADMVQASVRALPSFQKLLRDVRGGPGRHFEKRDAEVHQQLNEVGSAIELGIVRLARMQKMVDDVRDFSGMSDVATVARDLLGVIEGVPKLEPIAKAFAVVLKKLDGVQEMIEGGS